MSYFFRRFCGSVAFGFTASPLLRGGAVALCDSDRSSSSSNISADGQINHLFDKDPLPTRAELEYVKTWGIEWLDDWDQPSARGIRADRSSTFQRQIVMIRHGQYENEEEKDDNIRRLTPLGARQARATGVYLNQLFAESAKRIELTAAFNVARHAYQQAKECGAPTEEMRALQQQVHEADLAVRGIGGFFAEAAPRFVHVSNLLRARQTAELILEAFPKSVKRSVDIDPQLQERFPCNVEPKRDFAATAEDMKAAEDVFERYFHRPTEDASSVEVIVGHGNMIRYLTMRALQLPPEAWLRTSLPHCSVTTISIRGNGQVSLTGMGSYGHLPPDLVTVLNLA